MDKEEALKLLQSIDERFCVSADYDISKLRTHIEELHMKGTITWLPIEQLTVSIPMYKVLLFNTWNGDYDAYTVAPNNLDDFKRDYTHFAYINPPEGNDG